MNEPQTGGLIDRYWILNWIIVPTVIILLMVLVLKLFSCPYVNVVDSCFPYNLPNWVKIALPIFALIFIPTILIFLRRIK